MPRKNFQCPQCPAKFVSNDLLANHLVDDHGGAGPSTHPQPSTTRTLPCHLCSRPFSTEAGLRQHLKRDPDCAPAQKAWLRERAVLRRANPTDSIHTTGGDSSSSEQSAHNIHDSGAHADQENEGADGDGDMSESDSENGSEGNQGSGSESDAETLSEASEGMDWDLPGSPIPTHAPSDGVDETGSDDERQQARLEEVVDRHGHKYYLEDYPCETAGEPIDWETTENQPREKYPDVGELSDPQKFEIAHLLMASGVSGRFRNKYLRLKRLRHLMPWKNNRELVKDVDKLPHGAGWTVQALAIKGDRGEEIVEMWMRNALTIVKQILKNKRLGQFMEFKPKRKWTSPERTERIRDQMHTADWMWEMQAEIKDPNGTVITIIVSSDETKLTSFSGDKKAHPVYLTIGNLPKELRRRISKRANILLGYLPVPKLDCESKKDKRKFHKRELFHKCMRALLAPLAEASESGVEVTCADGGIRRIYPVLASYIADFPEQCKIACTKTTYCPLCTVRPNKRGDLGDPPLRTREMVVDAMNAHRGSGSAVFERLGLFDVEPFWEEFPHVNLGCLMTPDLLHQMHKGVMKDHLTTWVTQLLGKQVIDERHTSMPEYHGMRHFKNGISVVSQWTGRELKEMAKILLPVISDANPKVVKAGRALLDFLYLAHSSSLTDRELDSMDDALRTFHANKSVFNQLGTLKTKNAFHGIPKIHMISHYVHLIKMLGTPDGYNTETSERLHIDFAKMGYRASNKVNATKQMALYIQRVEALEMHAEHLADNPQTRLQAQRRTAQSQGELEDVEDDVEDDEEEEEWDEWHEEETEDADELQDAGVRVALAIRLEEFLSDGRASVAAVGNTWEELVVETDDPDDQGPHFHPVPELVLAQNPTIARVTLQTLKNTHGATHIERSLKQFVRKTRPRNETVENVVTAALLVNIWSRARLLHSPPPFKPSEGPHIDVIRAQPERIDRFDRVSRPARFDTVLVLMDKNAYGIHRYRPARVRVIFQLSPRLRYLYDGHLAYVEMFNTTSRDPVQPTGLFTTTRSVLDGIRTCAVVPLSNIRMTCHLAPRYSTFDLEEPLTTHSDVLQLCETFFLNIFATYFCYELFRHWSQEGSHV